jgi:hypothetical protein
MFKNVANYLFKQNNPPVYSATLSEGEIMEMMIQHLVHHHYLTPAQLAEWDHVHLSLMVESTGNFTLQIRKK